MTLAEFLIYLLQAHGETLKRLAALFGEGAVLELLERAGERSEDGPPAAFRLDDFEVPDTRSPSRDAPYAELEGAVHDLRLPAPLEFHLWAYPPYRALIESPLDLAARIPGPGGDAGLRLVDEALVQSRRWLLALGLPEPYATQASRVAHFPWLRFRTQALKRIGKRPVGPVY